MKELTEDQLRHLWGKDGSVIDYVRACISADRALNAPADQNVIRQVPEGWKLVPIEPTKAMVSAAQWEDGEVTAMAVWGQMIAEAPTPPSTKREWPPISKEWLAEKLELSGNDGNAEAGPRPPTPTPLAEQPIDRGTGQGEVMIDQTVTPEYMAWLQTPEVRQRAGIGGNEAWNAALAWHKEQTASIAQTAAARDVLAERERQVKDEGWTPEHDDTHDYGQMAEAAACYALRAHARNNDVRSPPEHWPWHPGFWKPATPRRMLVKAGALILAEIERLDRATAKSKP